MTTQEQKALELALDFVEDVYLGEWRGPTERQEEVITAIKKALVVDNQQLTTEAQQSNEQVEPVGVVVFIDGKKMGIIYDHSVDINDDLYTHPPVPYVTESRTAQPKPLTDEQIHEIYDAVARQEPYMGAVTRRNIVRAIEAAHGIKE